MHAYSEVGPITASRAYSQVWIRLQSVINYSVISGGGRKGREAHTLSTL